MAKIEKLKGKELNAAIKTFVRTWHKDLQLYQVFVSVNPWSLLVACKTLMVQDTKEHFWKSKYKYKTEQI